MFAKVTKLTFANILYPMPIVKTLGISLDTALKFVDTLFGHFYPVIQRFGH